jgi:uncharacterized membrane protein YidH (DUF202 family)
MMTSEIGAKFSLLVKEGLLSEEALNEACDASLARGMELETILLEEYRVPREALLEARALHYDCGSIEYDERLPIPPQFLPGLSGDSLLTSLWFPVIKEGDKVIIAANDPESPAVREEVQRSFPASEFEFRVALAGDIQWFIQDFLHAKPQFLIGVERTGLAFWRNTMAHWRTRLACYRTDFAKCRTSLAFLRWGVGLFALADALLKTHRELLFANHLSLIMVAAGAAFSAFGLRSYLRVRKARISPPRQQSLVEVTAATMSFLERYHIEGAYPQKNREGTMLGRLGDFVTNYSTILNPVPASKVRTQLARERNVLAAQRTLAACYRTVYSRARTGLAFMRTGVAFLSLGLVFLQYFGFGVTSVIDAVLVAFGLFMITDGFLWYMPARKEQEEMPRSLTVKSSR